MGTLKSFKQFEAEKAKAVTFTFGRFNPPTVGHGKLLDAIKSISDGSTVRVYVSQSNDTKKNPLAYEDKIKFLRKMFPTHSRSIILDAKLVNVFDILVKLHSEGFNKVTMVVGSDRVSDFRELLVRYNGVKAKHGFFEFPRGIEIVSAGERDPDSDDVSGMSSSKARAAAAANDLPSFAKSVPPGFGDVTSLFNAVRVGLGLKESFSYRTHVELIPMSLLREQFLKGMIFLEGRKVLRNGITFTVKQRKSNFIVCESKDKKIHKFWLNEVTEVNEEEMHDGYSVTYDGDSFHEMYDGIEELEEEAVYNGRKVELNKPTAGDVKKFKVFVRNKEGRVVKVNFGDPDSTIKAHIPARRKSFRARHKCDTDPAEKDTPRYWSCKKW